jgi:serine/threonine protein kinase
LAVACQTKANVSHLDIKPNNMIYCPAKQKLSLIDFGSARYLSPLDGRKLIPIGHPIGTKYYVAPEILNLNFNNRSDTYCIGRILQYFTDGGMSIGSDGNRLLARMLAVDPMIRPSLTEVMHSPWFSVGGKVPPASNAAPLVPSPRLIAV